MLSLSVHSVLQHRIVISEIAPCEGSPYFPLPKELNNTVEGLINIQNEDNEYFRNCLARYLNPAAKNPTRIRNINNDFAKNKNNKNKGIKFPATGLEPTTT